MTGWLHETAGVRGVCVAAWRTQASAGLKAAGT